MCTWVSTQYSPFLSLTYCTLHLVGLSFPATHAAGKEKKEKKKRGYSGVETDCTVGSLKQRIV
jgi:hypothetical protein